MAIKSLFFNTFNFLNYTVVSVLASALAAGQDLAGATALANLAAGVVVAKLGTASVTVPELRRAIREQDEVEQGVMDEDPKGNDTDDLEKDVPVGSKCRANKTDEDQE